MVYESYKDYIGMAYEINGNGFNGGIDCYELVVQLGEIYNIPFPKVTYDYDFKARNDVADSQRDLFTKVDFPAFGDIIAIRVGQYVCHIGFMLDHYHFIHATEQLGVIVSRTDSVKYVSRIEGYYRCKKN